MEEILASIRRIISEDDAPPAAEPAHEAAPTAHAPAPEPEPEPVTHAVPEPTHHEPVHEEEEEDVLELNEPAPTPRETHGDLDVFDAPKAAEPAPQPGTETPWRAPEPEPAPTFTAVSEIDHKDAPVGGGLVSGHAASAAASHFGALAQSIAMPAAGRTLEDLVGELLKPLLKDWLDQHLPGMVEQAVRDEVERISRRRVY